MPMNNDPLEGPQVGFAKLGKELRLAPLVRALGARGCIDMPSSMTLCADGACSGGRTTLVRREARQHFAAALFVADIGEQGRSAVMAGQRLWYVEKLCA